MWVISAHKREDVAGAWRRLHNEELHNSYASPHTIRVIIKENETGGGCIRYGRDQI
jgi:hypothetical protein